MCPSSSCWRRGLTVGPWSIRSPLSAWCGKSRDRDWIAQRAEERAGGADRVGQGQTSRGHRGGAGSGSRAYSERKRLGSMAKFLVVDDAAFMRMRCVKLLHENGFETVEAENGAQAV